MLEEDGGGNQRGGGVKLLGELAEDKAGGFFLGAFHQEAVAANELALTDEEDFHPGLVGVLGHSDDVQVASGVGIYLDLLLQDNLFDTADLVAEDSGAFELELFRGVAHLLAEVAGHHFGIAFHEHDDLVDDFGVLLLGGVAGAGGDAPVDEVFQTRAGVGAGNVLGTGAVGEQFFDEVHGMPDAAGGGERTEVAGAVLGDLAGYVNPGELFLEVDLEEGVGLVVLEAGVIAGFIALDQGVFQDEGLSFGIGNDKLEVGDLGDEAADLDAVARIGAEVGAKAVAENQGLTDVDNVFLGVFHQVDAGFFRRNPQAVFDQRCDHNPP